MELRPASDARTRRVSHKQEHQQQPWLLRRQRWQEEEEEEPQHGIAWHLRACAGAAGSGIGHCLAVVRAAQPRTDDGESRKAREAPRIVQLNGGVVLADRAVGLPPVQPLDGHGVDGVAVPRHEVDCAAAVRQQRPARRPKRMRAAQCTPAIDGAKLHEAHQRSPTAAYPLESTVPMPSESHTITVLFDGEAGPVEAPTVAYCVSGRPAG